MEQTFTHHFVDAFPELDELPQDQAMDAFRKLFPVLTTKLFVSKDGRTMSYRLRGTKLMHNYVQMARLIVIMHRLPLEVSNDRFAIGDVVFEDTLVITYTGR